MNPISNYGKGILEALKPGKPVNFCTHCGRTLTDPESVKKGIGPECEGRAARGEPPKKRK